MGLGEARGCTVAMLGAACRGLARQAEEKKRLSIVLDPPRGIIAVWRKNKRNERPHPPHSDRRGDWGAETTGKNSAYAAPWAYIGGHTKD